MTRDDVPQDGQPTGGAAQRPPRRLARRGVLIGATALLSALVIVPAALVYRARRTTPPSRIPSLPAGCSWIEPPETGCPAGDATAYRQWVRERGPLAVRHGDSGIELLWVPGGRFMMGSEDDNSDERPVHRVKVDGFWVGRTEVTVRQWRAVMGSVPGPDNDQGDDHPVVDVSWEDCQTFCRRMGSTLPTEAQWEYAARGPDARRYPWGHRWDRSLCRSAADRHGRQRTAPAGSFPNGASWCGGLDMAGNVWEWCEDWYAERFYESKEATRRDPRCDDGASGGRALRGGSWFDHADSCRSSARYWNYPSVRDLDIGLRVVCGPGSAAAAR